MQQDQPGAQPQPEVSRRRFLKLGGVVGAAGLAAPILNACSNAPSGAGNTPTGAGTVRESAPSSASATASASAAKEGGTFTWYTSSNHVYDTWKDVVSKFEADHGLKVNWQKYTFKDMGTKLVADFAGGTVPDLVEYNGPDNTMAFVKTGDVLALDPYIAKDGATMGYPSDWQDRAVTPWQYQGKTYGIQLQLTPMQLYYNKQMFKDAGVSAIPDTWDDFLAAAKALTSKNVYGIAINQDPFYGQPWILQSGATLYDSKSGQFMAPQDEAIRALQFQQDLVHKYKVSPVPVASSDQTVPRTLFAAKRVAMILTGPWDIDGIRKGAPDLDWGVGLPFKDKVRATPASGSGLIIPQKASRPDLAWDFIKRITALDVELAVTKESGQTMARKSWAAAPQVASDPLMTELAKALPYATDWAGDLGPTGKFPKVSAAYKTLYQSVVLSGKSPAAEMQAFVKAAHAALA